MIRPAMAWRLGVVLAGLAGAPCTADVVFDSFDTGGTFHPAFNLGAASASRFSAAEPIFALRLAVRFTVPAANGFQLDSIRLPISQQNSISGNFLRVRIAENAGGAPGPTLEVLSQNQPVPTFTNPFLTTTTLNSVLHPQLNAGASYWIVTELSILPPIGSIGYVDYRWFMTTAGAQVPFLQQQTTGGLPMDPWDGAISGTDRVPLRVDGTPIVPAACCNPVTGACAVVLTTSCATLGLNPVPGSTTCTPNPCPAGCPADFNGINGVTVQDIYDFLAAWNAGCP